MRTRASWLSPQPPALELPENTSGGLDGNGGGLGGGSGDANVGQVPGQSVPGNVVPSMQPHATGHHAAKGLTGQNEPCSTQWLMPPHVEGNAPYEAATAGGIEM